MEPIDNPHRQRRSTLVGLLLAAFFGSGAVLFLIFVTQGFFLYVLVALLAISVVGYVHYLLWGHALTQEVAGEREEVQAREKWEAEQPSEDDEYRSPRRF